MLCWAGVPVLCLTLPLLSPERALYSLECAFHPVFSLTSGTCRLDYRRPENRSAGLGGHQGDSAGAPLATATQIHTAAHPGRPPSVPFCWGLLGCCWSTGSRAWKLVHKASLFPRDSFLQ